MSATPLRLGFVRGTSPAKWARRWAEARPDRPLELVPLGFDGLPARRTEGGIPDPPDVRLERTMPGARPHGTADGSRLAVRLYAESVALVVAAEHELATANSRESSGVDLDTIHLLQLLDHPDHAPQWPAPEPWAEASWMPPHAAAAAQLVATGTGAALMPLPLARQVARGREHAVLPVAERAELAGTQIWASWPASLDGDDVQQLIGIMRGRTARSSRNAAAPAERAGGDAPARAKPAPAKPSRAKPVRAKSAQAKPRATGRGTNGRGRGRGSRGKR